MSVTVNFEHLLKKYGEKTVIPDLSLQVNEGEFFTLLGPSGCGKTTLLRMIAGFNSIEGGQIYFSGKPVNDLPANKRNIGMVFQNYAVFPNMTAAENVAFGLKNRKVPKNEIKKRVDEILKTVKIYDLKNTLPQNMSGGQQQRVALARAIVIRPDILLMDEPLSNLDAKLRIEMRGAIKEIQHECGITTIYVTHDQEEALAVSDRIAVMSNGVIQHVGRPDNIYLRPANQFVGTFIGRSNIVDAVIAEQNGKLGILFKNGYFAAMDNFTEEAKPGMNVKASVRPEEFVPCESGLTGKVFDRVFLGSNTHYVINLDDGTRVEMIQESSLADSMSIGEPVSLRIKAEKVNVFTEDGSRNLVRGVENDV